MAMPMTETLRVSSVRSLEIGGRGIGGRDRWAGGKRGSVAISRTRLLMVNADRSSTRSASLALRSWRLACGKNCLGNGVRAGKS